MEIMVTIDKVLQMAVVRWGLLILAIFLIALYGITRIRLSAAQLQYKAASADNAKLGASLSLQNEAIKKQGEAYATLEKQARDANARAAIVLKKLQKRKNEIRGIVLTGACENMVQQVLDEVLK